MYLPVFNQSSSLNIQITYINYVRLITNNIHSFIMLLGSATNKFTFSDLTTKQRQLKFNYIWLINKTDHNKNTIRFKKQQTN